MKDKKKPRKITHSCFSFYKFGVSVFFPLLIDFPKTAFFINLKKNISQNKFFNFFLSSGFYHTFWLYLMTLRVFSVPMHNVIVALCFYVYKKFFFIIYKFASLGNFSCFRQKGQVILKTMLIFRVFNITSIKYPS